MLRRTHRYLGTFLAGLLGVIVGSVGPGVARAAYDAVNADKVDGKHAVGSGATINRRKGKLVATSSTTGRLPDNIIAKALNSAALNGYPHSALRSFPLSAQAAVPEAGASSNAQGVSLPGSGSPSLNISFLVPPDHQDGSPVYLDIVYWENSPDACAWVVSSNGASGPVNGTFENHGWVVLPGTTPYGSIDVPAGTGDAFTQSFSWDSSASEPGDLIQFSLLRLGDHASDSCGAVGIYGMQVRY